MSRALKILAVVILVATIIGAAAVLYGVNTLTPEVVSVTPSVIPAAQVEDTFDALIGDWEKGLPVGKVYGDLRAVSAKDCSFVTYTVRLGNRGFFPAEWISLYAYPVVSGEEADLLVIDNADANVLPSGAQGDLSVTLLTSLSQPLVPRTIEVTCYVFGRKQTMHAAVE